MAKIAPHKNIPTTNFRDAQWIEGHKSIKKRYSRKVANTLFLETWQARGTSSANTTALRAYMKRNKIEFSRNAFEWTDDLFYSIGDIFAFGFGFTRIVTIVLVVIVVAFIALVLFKIGQRPIEAAQVAMQARTAGAIK